ncbi:MAG TPA: ATP-binding cassette domain-containing protein, partial [Pseudomonadales bacterium]|nr:ATP-binding cassette domain-containing protein [Pseudomonadales bacterium]
MSLRAINLTYHIGSCPIIDSVSLQIEPGRCVAIVGPNGAGKTTLFKLLSADLKPSAGEILLNQQTLTALSTAALAKQRAVL